MSMAKPNRLPVIVLPYMTVILPGTILRIGLEDRKDIQSLLQDIFSKQNPKGNATAVPIGCVPLRPPQRQGETSKEPPSTISGDEGDHTGQEDEKEVTSSDVAANLSVMNIDPASASPEDLFEYGTVVRLVGLERGRGGFQGAALVVEGLSRFQTVHYTQRTPYLEAEVNHLIDDSIQPNDSDSHETFARLKTLCREFLALLRNAAPHVGGLPVLVARRLELFIEHKGVDEAGSLADFFVSAIDISFEERLSVLEAVEVRVRLKRAVELVGKRVQALKLILKEDGLTDEDDNEGQERRLKQLILRNRRPSGSGWGPGSMNRSGGSTSGDNSGEEDEFQELRELLAKAKMSPEAERVAQREFRRLKRMSPMQAEYQVIRTYIEVLTEVPWTVSTDDQLDATTLQRARKQLDEDHYGLEKIKRRLLEYLAVLRLKRMINDENEANRVTVEQHQSENDQERNHTGQGSDTSMGQESVAADKSHKEGPKLVDKSPILLLVGPPGTGKTSLARSVATALNRKFHRISLGGVRDEAEIRGHRRTYVAAMPGLIVNAMRKVGVANPVILLDEIDKVGGANFHGDPSAALLEVLDPEQNWSFTDHYLSIPIDLSKVLFICTANSLSTIPSPLLDRMETIRLSGYTPIEKRHIAIQYLIPKQLKSNGLLPGQVRISEEALMKIISAYTRESGVRNLEREIGSVCRAKAVEFANAKDSGKPDLYNSIVQLSDLERVLGSEKYDAELAATHSKPGIVTGLVAFSISGNGSILFIEAADMPGNGRLQLTGKLGEVIKESVEVALTWVKAHAFTLGLTSKADEDLLEKRNVHVHCPAGAVPKDGPSAGVAFTVALVSLFSSRIVPPTIAMTGETTLRGRVTAVGGIKEKLIGALAAGVKTVILPRQNRKDVKELPEEVKTGLDIIFVSNIYEVLKTIWPDWIEPGSGIATLESML
ncbi:ATP-dependent protease La [Ascobolus immersus RN42]|uniref:Lon protease homolog 2, peroxisomal n=1 Tax=Ascobolus immersus RN42 TaxID=1160509 RepID=A0A3N4I9R6_ASCIM|nr:ATP-dependent protease La [Ascobolus immersus RN42]